MSRLTFLFLTLFVTSISATPWTRLQNSDFLNQCVRGVETAHASKKATRYCHCLMDTLSQQWEYEQYQARVAQTPLSKEQRRFARQCFQRSRVEVVPGS